MRWYWVAARCSVAGLLGWAAAWYSLFILLPVPMRWLDWGSGSAFLSISISF